RPRLWLAFSAGFLVSCFTLSAATGRDALRAYVDIATGAPGDIRYLFFEQDRWRSARERFFDADSFELDGMSGRQLVRQILMTVPMQPQDAIFVLGDYPFLYVLLKKPVPFYTNFYNQSPMYAQQKTVSWLAREKPEWLFWDPQYPQFDAVPNLLRVPLLFNYAVANYVPASRLGRFEILRRRRD